MISCYSSEHGYNKPEPATQVYLSLTGSIRCLCDKHAKMADDGGWTYINNADIVGDSVVVAELKEQSLSKNPITKQENP